MPRCPELTVCTGIGELAEHLLINVALSVAVVHGNVVDEVHRFGQEGGCGDGEAGVAHVVGIRGVVAEGTEKGKDMIPRSLVHRAGLKILEAFPALLFIRHALWVVTFGEDSASEGLFEARSFALLDLLHLIQAFEKEEVGDLFDDLDRVGNATRPESIPDAVNLIAYFAVSMFFAFDGVLPE
jgi:hypothetical protein